jgi:hypothetical protein
VHALAAETPSASEIGWRRTDRTSHGHQFRGLGANDLEDLAVLYQPDAVIDAPCWDFDEAVKAAGISE